MLRMGVQANESTVEVNYMSHVCFVIRRSWHRWHQNRLCWNRDSQVNVLTYSLINPLYLWRPHVTATFARDWAEYVHCDSYSFGFLLRLHFIFHGLYAMGSQHSDMFSTSITFYWQWDAPNRFQCRVSVEWRPSPVHGGHAATYPVWTSHYEPNEPTSPVGRWSRPH